MQCQMHDQGNQVFFCWLNGLTHFCQRVNCKHNLAYSLKAWCRCRNNTFTASVSVIGPSQYQQYGSNAPSRNFGHCNKKFASAQTDSLCLQDLLEQHALWITEEKSVFDPKVEKIQSNGLKIGNCLSFYSVTEFYWTTWTTWILGNAKGKRHVMLLCFKNNMTEIIW